MALFYDCWQAKGVTLQCLHLLLDDAAANAEREAQAAIDIQRLFRGQRVRATVTQQKIAEIVIARMFRGHLARRRCRQLREAQRVLRQDAVRNFYAVTIQKMQRGVASRRTRLDFRVRKAYIMELARRGEELRQVLSERLLQQQLDERRAIEEAAKKELVEVTQNLHHLVSTRAVSGVFNAPMAASAPATSFGVPVETHIRQNTKALLQNQLSAAKPPTRLQPYPPSNKATIQAASLYGADLRAVRTQKKYHKLRRLAPKDFQTGFSDTNDSLVNRTSPGYIASGIEYLDDWKNPYKKRGIPRSSADLLPELTTLDKAPKNPFYLTHGGNKSKVLTNDRFDV